MLESVFTPLVVPRVGETPIDVRSEADRARTRGYADGYADGRRIAAEEARAQQSDEHERMRLLREAYLHQRGTALAAVRVAHSALDDRAASLAELAALRVEELAVELAAAILGAELSDPARSAAHALRRALEATPRGEWTRVTFSERDGAVLNEDPDAAALLAGIEVQTSPGVDDGGAIVEIENGAVDTRITGALRRAAGALRGTGDDTPMGVPA
ncbi:FliH/SctL family protein [Microbacterium sp. NPDC057407]|uniref:FliH/SctL family protein n=1 Tax=Microbacterium sp. NPDC057407 TaxID=3346120 RepID=UPI00366E23AB